MPDKSFAEMTQSELEYIAVNDSDSDRRFHAIQRLRNQRLLYDITMKEKIMVMKKTAINGIYDISLLDKIIEENEDQFFKNDVRDRRREVLMGQFQCAKCGKKFTPEELEKCSCACGMEVHNYTVPEEEILTEDEKNHYYARMVYKTCSRCGKRDAGQKYERWGSDLE